MWRKNQRNTKLWYLERAIKLNYSKILATLDYRWGTIYSVIKDLMNLSQRPNHGNPKMNLEWTKAFKGTVSWEMKPAKGPSHIFIKEKKNDSPLFLVKFLLLTTLLLGNRSCPVLGGSQIFVRIVGSGFWGRF
jgi:hypothetical protein